jgi:hypothetical protein
VASAALGFAIMVPALLLLLLPSATALLGLLALELATLAWSLEAFRGTTRSLRLSRIAGAA